jgi:hypothetical protein
MTTEQRQTEAARAVMETPTQFVDGFGWRPVVGALFLGFVMMPGSIYLSLVTGDTLGGASQWVTIILFMEVARRSYQTLTRQEIYVLYYVAGAMISGGVVGGGAGGPFWGLIWGQYFIHSDASAAFRDQIPTWALPPANSPAYAMRTFIHHDFLVVILLITLGQIIGRAAWFGWGYTLFRFTSDLERLPFPLAPIAAQGATALAEASAKTETWRWRVFSIGSMLGIAFGFIYVGIPTITGVILVKPIRLLPIPWIDLTSSTEKILPATAMGIGTSAGSILSGFILPFWVVVGIFVGACLTIAINPTLYHFGLLTRWQPGMDTINTEFANNLDFWLSFKIGTAVAIGIIGIYKMVVAMKGLEGGLLRFRLPKPPAGRGDVPMWVCLGLMFISTSTYIGLAAYLVKGFPIYFFLLFGFVLTPFESFISARMVGITSSGVSFPYVREATYIFSGYRGVAIWYASVPASNYGAQAQFFREVELTGTKITSILKAEIFLVLPIVFVCSFIFCGLIWRMGPIPSDMYPYAQKMWRLNAMNSGLWMNSTASEAGRKIFFGVMKPYVIGSGLSFALIAYSAMSSLGWPVMAVYGFIQNMGVRPHDAFPLMFGALFGRYYMSKRLGEENWRRYVPVLCAGFACGTGLIAMMSIAFALLQTSIKQLPY